MLSIFLSVSFIFLSISAILSLFFSSPSLISLSFCFCNSFLSFFRSLISLSSSFICSLFSFTILLSILFLLLKSFAKLGLSSTICFSSFPVSLFFGASSTFFVPSYLCSWNTLVFPSLSFVTMFEFVP